jgi:hypothetical protein
LPGADLSGELGQLATQASLLPLDFPEAIILGTGHRSPLSETGDVVASRFQHRLDLGDLVRELLNLWI